MATLTGQTIASSYEQLLHVDTDGGGNTTTLVPVKDGDNGTTFAMQLSTTTVCIDNPTADSSTQGGILRLQSDDGALMQSGSRLGVIEFSGAEDSSNTITVGARIESVTDAAWSATENGADMVFYTTDGNASQAEVMRLTADNFVGIGTAAPSSIVEAALSGTADIMIISGHTADANAANITLRKSRNATVGSHTVVQDDDSVGAINFSASDGDAYISVARIKAKINGTPGNNDMPGELGFFTTADGASGATERMTIDAEGNVLVGKTESGTGAGVQIEAIGTGYFIRSGGPAVIARRNDSIGEVIRIMDDSSTVGTISTDGLNTAYNTSSDYRLKENEASISDGLERLNQLKPYRFNFKKNPDKTVDGFFAHEVAEVVPEAISGEKDAVDSDGNIDAQGIDHSKLVPLLVKAVQELTAKVEALENK